MTIREMTLKRAADLTDDMKWDLLYVSLLEEEGSRTLLKRMAEEPDRKRQMFYRYLYEQKRYLLWILKIWWIWRFLCCKGTNPCAENGRIVLSMCW